MTTMTAARILLRCFVVATVLSYNSLYTVALENDQKLLRASAFSIDTEVSLARQRRALKHHEKDNDGPPDDSTVMDTRPVISAISKNSDDVELTLDEEKAEVALEEEENAPPPPPTKAPKHHSHHHDKDKDKKNKEKSSPPTPSESSPKESPSPSAAPKAEGEGGNDADNDEDTTPTTDAAADDEEKGKDDTTKATDDDTHEEEKHGDEDFEETDDVPSQETSHTKKPVGTNDDEKSVISVDDDLASRNDDELEEELHEEETEAKVFGGFGFLIAIIAMIFTAHQMSENPDGIYASLCRLAITIVSCVVKAIIMPFRSVLGHRHHGGHMQLSTTEPYRSNHAMELT